MKISLKQILAVSALAVASTSAFADVALPSTGNGELALIVWDQTTGASYVRGLQINLDTIATTSAIAGNTYVAGSVNTTFNIPSINIAADANLQSFLAGAGGGDTITWGVMGGATSGTALGTKRYVTTTAQNLVTTNPVTNSKLTTSWSQMGTWDTGFNGAIENSNSGNTTVGNGLSNAVENSITGAASSTNALFTSVIGTWAGTGVNNQVALGSAANLYLVANSSTSASAAARIYTLSGLTLDAVTGALTGGAAAAPVPVPAALWLLGSGLAGLVGIGRRKQVA